ARPSPGYNDQCLEKRSLALQACNRTRNIQADGVPRAHRAPGHRRSQGPFFCHWTPEPCLEKRTLSLLLIRVNWLGPSSPPKGSLASASPTSHGPDGEPWPPGRSSSAADPHAGPARNTRGPSASDAALARRPRRPVDAPPARLRG